MAPKNVNYTKIGVFVFLSIALAVLIVIAVGVGAFNKSEILYETYIEESAQGLDVGAPVKYKGIPVGHVKSVSFVWPTYKPEERSLEMSAEWRRAIRYARIVFSVESDFSDESVNTGKIRERFYDGLRVFVKTQGITGMMYLEIDYARHRPDTLPVPWTPKYRYIPSAPGIGTALSDAFRLIMGQIAQADVTGTVASVSEAVSHLNAEIKEAQIGRLGSEAGEAVAAINALLNNGNVSIEETLYNLNRTSELLMETAEKIRDRPSILLRDEK